MAAVLVEPGPIGSAYPPDVKTFPAVYGDELVAVAAPGFEGELLVFVTCTLGLNNRNAVVLARALHRYTLAADFTDQSVGILNIPDRAELKALVVPAVAGPL